MILWHHAVTFLLLQIPLKHPQLGRYTCMDGEAASAWGVQGKGRRAGM